MKTWIKNASWTAAGVAFFQLFHGASALLGGYLLVSDPSGSKLGLKPDWLESTPFTSYLIPGLVLLVVNGLGNTGGLVVTILKNKRAGDIAILFGFIMLAWIVAQVSWIGYQSVLQPLYFFTGLGQLMAGLSLKKAMQQ